MLIGQLITDKYKPRSSFSLTFSGNLVHFGDGGFTPGAESHLWIHLKPRAGLGLFAGTTGMAGDNTGENAENGISEKVGLSYFGANIILKYSGTPGVNSWFSWGLGFGSVKREERMVFHHSDGSVEVNEEKSSEKIPGMTMKAGLDIPVTRHLQIVTDVGILLIGGFNTAFQLGFKYTTGG